ncbi:MAG: protein kinase [Anaerolineae bacterium]|nr:protein kinase [Anaerolineae bacterium]
MPKLFNYGDYLGNIKILETLRVLRTATIYKAERGFNKDTELLLLKVANPGSAYEQYLQEESNALRFITQKAEFHHKSLPKWVHHGAVNSQDAYGIASFREQTRYYCLMEYVEGEFLSDFLLDNPQPWHEHVGWFIITLTEAIQRVQKATGKLHLNLNPDVILVKRNYAGVPQPVLLDLGLLQPVERLVPTSEAEQLQHHLQAAYTPRELVHGGEKLVPAADVYELGLILFEMLAGQPAYPYILRRTEDIYKDIEGINLTVPRRDDLPKSPRQSGKRPVQPANGDIASLLDIVRRSVRADNRHHYQDVSEFRLALLTIYGEVPEGKQPFNFRRFFRNAGRTIAIGTAVVFVIFVLVTLLTALF